MTCHSFSSGTTKLSNGVFPPVNARATQRRSEILEAATSVFAEKGYHETGIADIAARLNAGHGTFYRYFKNKRDIFLNVVVDLAMRLLQAVQIERPGATNTAEEYRQQVRRWGRRLIDLVKDDPQITRILLREAIAVDDELTSIVNKGWDTCAQITESYLVNGKKKGFLRADLDTRITSMALNAMIFEGMRRGVGNTDSTEDADAWINAIEKLMFDGIAKENR